MGGIRQEEDFKTRDNLCNIIWLIKTIRGDMFKFKGMKYNYLSMIESRSAIDRLYQDCQEKKVVSYNRFVSMMDSLKHCGGTIGR